MTSAVDALVTLKKEYKALTGSDYKPANTASATVQKENKAPSSAAASASASASSAEGDQLAEQITRQGEKVRDLKTNKANKVSRKRFSMTSFDKMSDLYRKSLS